MNSGADHARPSRRNPAANLAAALGRLMRSMSRKMRAARTAAQLGGSETRTGAPPRRTDHEANARAPQALASATPGQHDHAEGFLYGINIIGAELNAMC